MISAVARPHLGRMPIFTLNQKMELHWLDPELTDKGMDYILDYEILSTHLKGWPVYTIRIPKGRPDDKGTIRMRKVAGIV